MARTKSTLLHRTALIGIRVSALLVLLSTTHASAAEGPSDEAPIATRRPEIQLELGYTHDTNVTRARVASDILHDNIFAAQASTDHVLPINANSRVTLTGVVGADGFARYSGLGRIFGEAQASIDYRASGEFDAATFGAFIRLAGDRYESRLRRGYRYTFGATVQRALTDRINVFGAIAREERRAESAVFEGRNYSARLNLDYALHEHGTLYVGGDYRHGDTVSSGRASLENIDTAKVLVQDNAFRSSEFFSYRFNADTLVSTLGYNHGLGPKASIDLAWRHAVSRPKQSLSFATTVPERYVSNQILLNYALRF